MTASLNGTIIETKTTDPNSKSVHVTRKVKGSKAEASSGHRDSSVKTKGKAKASSSDKESSKSSSSSDNSDDKKIDIIHHPVDSGMTIAEKTLKGANKVLDSGLKVVAVAAGDMLNKTAHSAGRAIKEGIKQTAEIAEKIADFQADLPGKTLEKFLKDEDKPDKDKDKDKDKKKDHKKKDESSRDSGTDIVKASASKHQ